MQFKNYYGILGVNKNASDEEVHKAYRRLAKQFHPDINSDPTSTEHQKEINEAYAGLKDPKKRAMYDSEFDYHFSRGGSKSSGTYGNSTAGSENKQRTPSYYWKGGDQASSTDYWSDSQAKASEPEKSSLYRDAIKVIKTIITVIILIYLVAVFVYMILKKLNKS
jgi:curved DNA-binding protein CbpA